MNLYPESDLIPLSALQHLLFCERQCALIHIEQAWIENVFTAEGRLMHERADSGKSESRGNVKTECGLLLRSLRLGLSGKADVVEFHYEDKKSRKLSQVKPIEYKRGRPKEENWDRVQLCAQAICLEEMLGIEIAEGSLFYGKTRRRKDVLFNAALRQETEDAAKRLHELIASGQTPKAVYSAICDNCSMIQVCLPKAVGKKQSVSRYLEKAAEEL